MNYPLVLVHWVSMFVALAGGVMLTVWLYKNTKPKNLLTVILLAIAIGLIGSYLTFEYEIQFMYSMFGGRM